MQKYCHIKCKESLSEEYKIISADKECECLITDYDYDAYLFSREDECWCDDCDYGMCDDCSRKSYASYRCDADKIDIKCEVCKEESSSCCLSGYYTIDVK